MASGLFAFLKETDEVLKNVLADIEVATVAANLELGDHDWRSRAGMENMKAEAKRQLPELNQKYFKELFNSIVKVFVDGPSERITGVAKELNKDIFSIHVSSMYESIATLVKPKLGLGNEFGADAYFRLVEVLGDLSRAHNIVPINNPQPVIGLGVANDAELVALVRRITRDAFGDSLNRVYILNSVATTALAEKMDKKYCVVLISGITEEERANLAETLYSGKPTFTLEITDDGKTDKSLAATVFNKMYSTLSSNRGYHKKKEFTNIQADVINPQTIKDVEIEQTEENKGK